MSYGSTPCLGWTAEKAESGGDGRNRTDTSGGLTAAPAGDHTPHLHVAGQARQPFPSD